VKQDGEALRYATNALRDDFTIVCHAVKNKGTALKWASNLIKMDQAVVLLAMDQDSEVLV